ncbi:hypothetical protein CRE_02487 [Caenorhabditis remanei]|uniref:Serpentine receptor class gamma n=1 Tax=Caenorhabditis remanei TaxID=31234 RepID=E3MWS9_CAERE|nr:hypothetical protein CRE_02487 [Caenorhabditis remanei]
MLDFIFKFWLFYGSASLLLMVFLIILLSTDIIFSHSFYRIITMDILLNIFFWLNTWPLRIIYRGEDSETLLWIYESSPKILDIVSFLDIASFHIQTMSSIIICIHRLSTVIVENSNRFWKRWYLFCYLGIGVYSCLAAKLVALPEISYDYESRVFLEPSIKDESQIIVGFSLVYIILIIIIGTVTLLKIRNRLLAHAHHNTFLLKKISKITIVNSCVYAVLVLRTVFSSTWSFKYRNELVMTISDVIHSLFFLSFASKRTKEMIKSTSHRKYISLCIDTYSVPSRVSLTLKVNDTYKIVVMWSFIRPPLALEILPPVVLDIDGLKVKCCLGFDAVTSAPTIFCNQNIRKKICASIHNYAWNLFGQPPHIIVMCNKELEDVGIHGTAKLCYLPAQCFDGRIVDRFFRNFNVTNTLIMGSVAGTHKYPVPDDSPFYKTNNLGFGNCAWVPNILKKFQGRNGVFLGATVENSEVFDFLKTWSEGEGNIELESIVVRKRTGIHGDSLLDRNLILESFYMKQWDPLRRQAEFDFQIDMKHFLTCSKVELSFDCTDQFDIERKTDGMLATVVINTGGFDFFVWRNSAII